MKPIIGITCGTDERSFCGVNKQYCSAICRAGGIPVILPPTEDPVTVIGKCGGILLSGGGDIAPRLCGIYDYDPARLNDPDPERDRYELRLAALCTKMNIPILGICRGIQILNTALGGSLHFHISGHMQKADRDQPSHRAAVKSGTLLHSLVGCTELHTNSFHHQAVCVPGDPLDISAIADDGVIEALELPGSRFCVGVQWHPEHLECRESDILFAAFCAAAAH